MSESPPEWLVTLLAKRETEVERWIGEVIRAWAIGYPDPDEHAINKSMIRAQYPRLFRAMEGLVRAYREANSEPPRRYGENGEFPF